MSEVKPIFLHRRAKKQANQPEAVLWYSNNYETANATLDYLLIKAGKKLKDYFKAVATNFPVVNEIPEEGEISFTFCDYYRLREDGMTWEQIPGVTLPSDNVNVEGDSGTSIVDGVDITTGEILNEYPGTDGIDITADDDQNTLYPVVKLRKPQRIISQLLSDTLTHHVSQEQRIQIGTMEMDTDNYYIQNLLLAAQSIPEIDKLTTANLWKLTDAVKKVFPTDKRTELGVMLNFLNLWLETPHLDRGILVKEWAAGHRITSVQRTDTGTTAGGGNQTDRNPDYTHTLDTLDVEIALATLPMDFDIYNFPVSVHRRAKEIVQKKESPFKEWSAALRKTAGILDYSRAAIFALIRGATSDIHHFPVSLQTYINANLTEHKHDAPSAETLEKAGHVSSAAVALDAMKKSIDGDENKPVLENLSTDYQVVGAELVKEAKTKQPEVANLGAGVFSIEGLMASPAPTSPKEEATSNVQMEAAQPIKDEVDNAISAGESADAAAAQTDAVNMREILAERCPDLTAAVLNDQAPETIPEAATEEPVQASATPAWPEYFEPGRYEGLPNEVYHAANGISSTMVKDARVSLMYFDARHVSKTIQKMRSPVLDMGNLVHALALQPDDMDKEFSVEPEIPEGAFTTTATIRAFIDEYNNGLPVLLSSDDIKRFLEEYNATLPAQIPLGTSVEETGQGYMSLPAEFQRIEDGQKQTATAMKACIKEYNATLPAPVKTSGSRDALLEQLAIINPDLVAQEAQKPQPLKVSGTKTDLIQVVKSVRPDAVFADELLDAWRENPEGKVLVTRQQLSTALAIQKALLNHPTAGKLLTHPSRAVEVSYFGIDEETGLEIRVRPDLEIDMGGLRIGADLKTISMWNVKQEGLRAKLHREIIERDYHLSAAMYCETAALDQFFWIFVNKDENYHWIAIIEASEELLELGMLEYRKAMRAIAHGFDTGEWPAPITADYAEELNDFDVRRLEALREQAKMGE